MLGSRKVRPLAGSVVIVLALLGVALALPTLASAQESPQIRDYYLDPSTPVGPEGGTVQVVAQIDAAAEPITATAIVTGPTGSFTSQLSTSFGGYTTGYITIPANPTPDPVSWLVVVHATDGNGATASEPVGSVEVGGQPPFDEPPFLWDPSVAPGSVPAAGGSVTLAVSASDAGGISHVSADVIRPDGTHVTLPLEPISPTRFSGEYVVPPNAGTARQDYRVIFTATDDTGLQGSSESGFSVDAPAPPPPATGKLSVAPGILRFGDVTIGKSATRWIAVTNNSGRKTKPLAGTLSSTGAPFYVLGTSTFTLRPGQSKSFRVAFRPTAPGARTGRVAVRRSDGGQPALGVVVDGRGTCTTRRACTAR